MGFEANEVELGREEEGKERRLVEIG